MKRIFVKSSYRITVKKQMNQLHYYIRTYKGKEVYLFTRTYSPACYRICKECPLVNTVLCLRAKNKAVMHFVTYLQRMIPYIVEYYELEIA